MVEKTRPVADSWPFRELGTPRLRLRSIEHEDAAGYFDIFSDPEAMEFWSGEPIGTQEEAVEMLRQDLRWTASGDALCWGVAGIGDDRLIGKVSLYFFSRQNRRAEVGYILNRAHWRKGLMTEALGTVLDYGFGTLGLHRIEADVDPAHAASLALLGKFGFAREGLFRDRWRVHDRWHDSVMLGLLADEYRRPPGPG